ncbi:MAG: protein pelota [Candidatus Nanohaloarchaea archaeon]|jgi:protein pelota
MKLLNQDRKEGYAKIEVENEDDLWRLKDFFHEGDKVRKFTQRTMLEGREKKSMKLTIEVEKHSFENGRLRLTGEITEAGDDVELGYHSFNVESGSELEIWRNFSDKDWDNLEKWSEKDPYSVLFCLVEKGEADFYIVRESGIKSLSGVEENLPGKMYGSDKSEDEFLKQVAATIRRVEDEADYVVIGGPGFVKERLKNFLEIDNLFVQDTSVTGKTGLHEAIKRGALDKVVRSSRVADETTIVEEFLEKLRKDDPVSYGEEVEELAEMGAVETLIITPKKVREKKGLVETVEQQGGEVKVVHTDHEAGERIEGFTGVAAILRYRV